MKLTVLFGIMLCVFSTSIKAQVSMVPPNAGLISYQIIPAYQSTRQTKATDLVFMNYRMAIARTDSVLNENFTTNQPVHIEVEHPSFKKVLLECKAGDRVSIVVLAEPFFKYTLKKKLPAYVKKTDSLNFFIKVVNVLTPEEMLKNQSKMDEEQIRHDSIHRAEFRATFEMHEVTKSGLVFVKIIGGKGDLVKSGQKVLIRYKAYTLEDGNVVDKSDPNGLMVTIGQQQIVKGLEEGIQLMNIGSRYKFLVPYYLAYGAEGSGKIKPYESVVFDIELVNILK